MQINYKLLDLLSEHGLDHLSVKGDILLPQWYELNPDIEDNLYEILIEPRKRVYQIGLGYTLDESSEFFVPVPTLLVKLVIELGSQRYLKQRTIVESMDRINNFCADVREQLQQYGDYPYRLSNVGSVSQLFTRFQKRLGIPARETGADRVKKVIKERKERYEQSGMTRPRHLTKTTEKKIEKAKKLTETNRELQQLKEKEKRLKAKAARQARELQLKKDPTKYSVSPENPAELLYEATVSALTAKARKIAQQKKIEEQNIAIVTQNLVDRYQNGLILQLDEHQLMAWYREIMDNQTAYNNRKIAFLPTPRQYQFLSADEDIVLFGGAAGGGKSFSMTMDPLRSAHIARHNGLIIRKTMSELDEIIDISREYYPLAFSGAKYNQTKHVWTFPSGGKIRFGYLDKPSDKYQYQGKGYTYIGWDELSQHETDEGFVYLRSRLRTAEKGIRPYIRATANPGSQWVYDTFIEPAPPNTRFFLKGTEDLKRPITVRFIPARLEDNPYLDNEDSNYRAMLESLPEVERRMLLDGDWFASKDNMFPEFDLRKHVIEPFTIPAYWNRVAGLDYGYRDPSAGVWFAVSPEDGTLIVYDEFLQTGLTGAEFAHDILEKERNEMVPVTHPIDWSVFNRTGHTGPTIAESMLGVPGMQLRRADKNREGGWLQLHEYLRVDPNTGAPKIQIFSTCKGLIRQLISVKAHKNKPNDINDTRTADGHWDLLDALRYGIMSRPRLQTYDQSLLNFKQVNRWDRINNYFSV